MAPSVGLRPFTFARVFEQNASQEEVYERCGRAAVADLLNGQSGCVLVYGQTGSGKVADLPAVPFPHHVLCRVLSPSL